MNVLICIRFTIFLWRLKLPSRTLCTSSIEVGANALQKKVAQKNMTSFSKIEILIYYLLTYNSFSKKKILHFFFRCGFILLNLIFIAIIMKLPTRKRSRKEILANVNEEATIWKIFVPSKSNNSKEDANNNAGENNKKIENV